ncbi:phosphonate metabolism protein/1,5-bisphosphokinase (PRPP-forming) PhnN [Pelagibacterium lentulum]|uniref:Ribose 1,5-bisphosphate phosphokinase PhnN n=1 Tax=Pelagibacterium lentulum TaxID=2029865 RepID=A0A916R799_9HYPH|nr:phosphonate metabolism protein/1,5-bisphosphokinase (PRPP-forming) PhnN [Pelagibacterium lentulum]GGA38994.1 ribose 1,5-bisphosphate phosphokinase PhnN [Pelagibacterium lentulum]
MASGAFIAVVGPSGAGKDSILNFAKRRFVESETVTFVRRFITRPGEDATEDHIPVTEDDFLDADHSNRFALSWHAHGLRYGIPIATIEQVRSGTTVVANLSRTMIAEARQRYGLCFAVAVSVDAQVLRQRLEARGRETRQEIEHRLARMDFSPPQGVDIVIENNGPLELAGEQLCGVIASVGAHKAQLRLQARV